MIKYPAAYKRKQGESFPELMHRIFWTTPTFFFGLINLAILTICFFYLYPHAGEEKKKRVQDKIFSLPDNRKIDALKKLTNGIHYEINDYAGMITYRVEPVSRAFSRSDQYFYDDRQLITGSDEQAVLRVNDHTVFFWGKGRSGWDTVPDMEGFEDLDFPVNPLVNATQSAIYMQAKDTAGRGVILKFTDSEQPQVSYFHRSEDVGWIRTIQDDHIINSTEEWYSYDLIAIPYYDKASHFSSDTSRHQRIPWDQRGKEVIRVSVNEYGQLCYYTTDSVSPKGITLYTLGSDPEDGSFYWMPSETWKLDLKAYAGHMHDFFDDYAHRENTFYKISGEGEKLRTISVLRHREDGTFSTSTFALDPKSNVRFEQHHSFYTLNDSLIVFREGSTAGFHLIHLNEDGTATVLYHFRQENYEDGSYDYQFNERFFYILSIKDNKSTLITVDLLTGEKRINELPSGEYSAIHMSMTPGGVRFAGIIGDRLAVNTFALDASGKVIDEQLVYLGAWPANPFNIYPKYNPAPMVILPIIYLTFFIIILIHIRDYKARLASQRELAVISRIPSLEARFLELQVLTTNLKRRSEIMLVLGIFFALFGVGVFSLLLTGMKEELALVTGTWEQIIIFSKPTVLLIFIEAFSFFFLRQYRVIFNEYKDFYVQYQKIQRYFHLLEVTDANSGIPASQQKELLDLLQKEDISFSQLSTDNQLVGSEFKDILAELRGISEGLRK